MDYPAKLELSLENDAFRTLHNHSKFIKDLLSPDEDGKWLLSADILFGGDQTKWELFYDIFFPETAIRPVFIHGKNVDTRRATPDDIRKLFDYMMIDEPDTMMNFAKKLAAEAINAPRATVPHGVGTRSGHPSQPAPRTAHRSYNNNNNNNIFNNNNNNNNNYNDVKLGHTNEEYQFLGRLSRGNQQKYMYPEGVRRTRRTRRTRRGRRYKRPTKKTQKYE